MNQLEKPIVSWFKKNKRDLPWRNTTPWGVMVSEYMLQQTPVNRVLPKWDEWMKRWPTPKDLAKGNTGRSYYSVGASWLSTSRSSTTCCSTNHCRRFQ
jgi:A/G-specific adenine glycosylase